MRDPKWERVYDSAESLAEYVRRAAQRGAFMRWWLAKEGWRDGRDSAMRQMRANP